MTNDYFPGNEKLYFCEGKEPFETFEMAQNVARNMRRRKHVRKVPYLCRNCNKFHIGSPKAKHRNKPDVEK